MPTIKQLTPSMINKIAAGEVIERPASVIKELVENAIDAGATRIDIDIDRSGIERIKVVDNGCGIAQDQLQLALTSHATSKVEDTEDLFRIQTFGFRGEALASIAEISQLVLRSRTADSTEGAEIRSDGGTLCEPIPCGMPVGTSFDISNLFFNTPVRRKYMRAVSTEFGHILEALIRLTIPQPQVHFTLKHNQKIVHDLPPEEKGLARIGKLFGADIRENLIYVESKRPEITVSGFVGHPKISRSNGKLQYFFLNGRYIRDRSLQHALSEAYRGFLTVGRFPIAFLKIEMSAELFDVNVHPSKLEVRFLDSTKIYSNFLGAIRERFLTVDMNQNIAESDIAKAGFDKMPEPTPFSGSRGEFRPYPSLNSSSVSNEPSGAIDPNVLQRHREDIVNWTKERIEQKIEEKKPQTAPSSEDINRFFDEAEEDSEAPKSTRLEFHEISSPVIPKSPSVIPAQAGTQTPALTLGASGSSQKKAIQIHDRYIIVETETGVGIIDQHALHERILYEQLKVRFAAGKIDSQRLLVPFPLDLSPTEFACVQENRENLLNLGILVEPFGGDTILVSGYPAILDKADPQELVLGIVDTLLDYSRKTGAGDLWDEILHQMSCKAAIKAGDPLRPDALERLLELADGEVNSHHCPHGRPAMLVFSCAELDKMFKRT